MIRNDIKFFLAVGVISAFIKNIDLLNCFQSFSAINFFLLESSCNVFFFLSFLGYGLSGILTSCGFFLAISFLTILVGASFNILSAPFNGAAQSILVKTIQFVPIICIAYLYSKTTKDKTDFKYKFIDIINIFACLLLLFAIIFALFFNNTPNLYLIAIDSYLINAILFAILPLNYFGLFVLAQDTVIHFFKPLRPKIVLNNDGNNYFTLFWEILFLLNCCLLLVCKIFKIDKGLYNFVIMSLGVSFFPILAQGHITIKAICHRFNVSTRILMAIYVLITGLTPILFFQIGLFVFLPIIFILILGVLEPCLNLRAKEKDQNNKQNDRDNDLDD